MKSIISLLILFFGYLAAGSAQAPGRLAGKILNEKNEPLAGVTIRVKGVNRTTASAVDGTFTIAVPADIFDVIFISLGYATKTITGAEVKGTGIIDLDVVLQSTARDLETVEIKTTSSARRETVNAAVSFQRNTNTVASVVSAEAIRRLPSFITVKAENAVAIFLHLPDQASWFSGSVFFAM